MMKGGDTILKKKQIFMAFVVALVVIGSFGVPAASAKTNSPTPTKSADRPGWGFGDEHHHHVGPPGHSVRPGDGDNDKDDHGHHISQTQFKQFLTELQSLFKKYFG